MSDPTSSTSVILPFSLVPHCSSGKRSKTPKTKASNLARIRDNQRRSRARRKEYIQELEAKYRECEALGIKASAEMQQAARKVLDENKKLRILLKQMGMSDEEVNRSIYNITPGGEVAGSSSVVGSSSNSGLIGASGFDNVIAAGSRSGGNIRDGTADVYASPTLEESPTTRTVVDQLERLLTTQQPSVPMKTKSEAGSSPPKEEVRSPDVPSLPAVVAHRQLPIVALPQISATGPVLSPTHSIPSSSVSTPSSFMGSGGSASRDTYTAPASPTASASPLQSQPSLRQQQTIYGLTPYTYAMPMDPTSWPMNPATTPLSYSVTSTPISQAVQQPAVTMAADYGSSSQLAGFVQSQPTGRSPNIIEPEDEVELKQEVELQYVPMNQGYPTQDQNLGGGGGIWK